MEIKRTYFIKEVANAFDKARELLSSHGFNRIMKTAASAQSRRRDDHYVCDLRAGIKPLELRAGAGHLTGFLFIDLRAPDIDFAFTLSQKILCVSNSREIVSTWTPFH